MKTCMILRDIFLRDNLSFWLDIFLRDNLLIICLDHTTFSWQLRQSQQTYKHYLDIICNIITHYQHCFAFQTNRRRDDDEKLKLIYN